MNGQKDLREDKSIPVGPVRILRVKSHEPVEHNVGDWSHAHGGSGVAGIRFEGGIDLDFG